MHVHKHKHMDTCIHTHNAWVKSNKIIMLVDIKTE